MLHALRMDPIHVQMELSQQGDDEDGVSQKIVNRRGSKRWAPPNEFLFLRVRIRNVSRKFRTGFRVFMTSKQCRDRTATGLIFTANMFFEPEKYVIYQGVLRGIPVGEVRSGETRELEMTICFVSCGRFELRSQVEILNAPRGELAGSGRITVLVEDG